MRDIVDDAGDAVNPPCPEYVTSGRLYSGPQIRRIMGGIDRHVWAKWMAAGLEKLVLPTGTKVQWFHGSEFLQFFISLRERTRADNQRLPSLRIPPE